MGKARIVPNRENYNIGRKEKEHYLKIEISHFLYHSVDNLWSGHHMYMNPLKFSKDEIKRKLTNLLDETLRDMDRRYERLRNDLFFFTHQTEDGKLRYKMRKKK